MGPEELAADPALQGGGERLARRILAQVHRRRAIRFAELQGLSARLRARLEERFTLELPRVLERVSSEDGACRYRLELADGEQVEAVTLRYGERRWTLCLSTQVGCRMGCRFCATGAMGLRRNLRAGEMISQAVLMLRAAPIRRFNIVFMGMGEPLDNLEELLKALDVLTADWGLARSPRLVSVSTIGPPEGLARLLQVRPKIQLTLSLNAPDEALRGELMPATRAWPLEATLRQLAARPEPARSKLIHSYVLLAGINDSPEQARALAARLGSLPGPVNLLAYNEIPELPFRRPEEAAVERFRQALFSAGRPAHPRFSKGRSVRAACGQLATRARGPGDRASA
jgi:23S rRNA (adenine2503-C2)-methyltransferase